MFASRALTIEVAFPELWTPPEVQLGADDLRALRAALSSYVTDVKDAGPFLAEPGLELVLVLRGEVEVVRRPWASAAPGIVRAGRGTVLNVGALHRRGQGPELGRLPEAPAPVVELRPIERPRISKLDWIGALASLAKTAPKARDALAGRLRSLYAVHVAFERLVASLRRLPYLERLSLSKMCRLLTAAQWISVEGRRPCPVLGEGQETDTFAGIYVPSSAGLELATDRAQVPAKYGVPAKPWRAFSTLDVRQPITVGRRTPTGAPEMAETYFIPATSFFELLRTSESIRRTVRRASPPDSQTRAWAEAIDQTSVELVVFDADTAERQRRRPEDGLRSDLVHLADALAEELAGRYGDRVLRVAISRRSSPGATLVPGPRSNVAGYVDHLDAFCSDLGSSDEVSAWSFAHLAYWLGELVTEYDYVLATSEDDDVNAQLQVRADTRIILSPDTRAAGEDRTLALRDDSGAEVLAVYTVRSDMVALPSKAPLATAVVAPLRWTRVQFDASRPRPSDVEHLARALSGRMVGVALGGGGALGMANAVLLEVLLERGVPVNAVAGNSFGSVVGAFFAAHEPDRNEHEGLRKLQECEQLLDLQLATLGGILKAGLIERHINRRLGSVLVRDCPIRFLPFSVRADTLDPVLLENVTVGEAVAASGAAPSLGAPVWLGSGKERVRFLDGAVLANVPAEALIEVGCGVVVALDPIPKSGDRERRNRLSAPIERLLAAVERIDPLGLAYRVVNGLRSSERALSSMSESSASPADVFVKIPFGSVLRMPFFLYRSDLLKEARGYITKERVTELIAALYEGQRNVADDRPTTGLGAQLLSAWNRQARLALQGSAWGLPRDPWKPQRGQPQA